MGESGGEQEYGYIYLQVYNPCVLEEFTSILVPDDYHIDYFVNSDAMTVVYTKGFSVGNSEEVAALCGPISYKVQDSSTIPEIEDRQPDANELLIYSNDIENMIGHS